MFFDDFWLFMPEQIAAAKVKKNRRNLRKSWLAILDEILTKRREDILSQTELIKQIDLKEIEKLKKDF